MTISPGVFAPSHADVKVPGGRRRMKKTVALAMASLIGCAAVGSTGCTSGIKNSDLNFGPTGGQIALAAIGVSAVVVGTVVLVEVHHSHHTLKGCVSSGQNGFQVQTQGDLKTYALTGDTANVKAGDLVRFHGNRMKKVKGSAGNPTFTVEKVSRDYGPCTVISAPPASASNGR